MTWDPSAPIQHDFPEAIQTIAKAGYGAHVADNSHARSWTDLRGHERFRWLLAADQMVCNQLDTPEQIRAIYFTGYLDMPWEDAKPGVRKRWQGVRDAMWHVHAAQLAEEKRIQEQAAAAAESARREAAKAQRKQAKRPVITPPTTTFTRPEPPKPTGAATLRERLIEKQRERRKEASA